MSARPAGARWLLPAATLVLLALGAATVAVAATLSLTDADEPPLTTGTAIATPPPEVPALSGDLSTDGPVSELADPAWLARTARAADLPERALAAYAGASIAVTRTHPGCGLGWNTLAAIGLVESEHGSIGKSSLRPSGVVRPPIIGVALNGDGVAAIRDTDRGRLDGDTTWDRAVGPMQFIPSTWAEHATDGDQDGTTDIHDIDDAALTAAVYLCSTGRDLTQPDGWIAAVSVYNRDTGYIARVAEAATAFVEMSSKPPGPKSR